MRKAQALLKNVTLFQFVLVREIHIGMGEMEEKAEAPICATIVLVVSI